MAKVTIKMIAEKAEVSRGTVDRVLNNRPYVNDAVKQRVLQIAKELDYKPNLAAKALKSNDRELVIRVILPSFEKSRYSHEVQKGVEFAKQDFANVGITVEIVETEGIHPKEQYELLKQAEEDKVAGVALIPFEDAQIIQKLKELSEKMPVITLNTDVGDVGNICYIGQNPYAGGRVAAQLMSLLTKGQGNILVAIGYDAMTSHKQRRDGFVQYMEKYPGLRICDTFENQENNQKMYELLDERFAKYGEIDGVYVCAGGIKGLCDYLLDRGLEGQISVICAHAFDYEMEMMKKGVIDFAIGEQLFEQGYFSIKFLAAYLLEGKLPKEKHAYTNIDIRNCENMDYSFSFYTK